MFFLKPKIWSSPFFAPYLYGTTLEWNRLRSPLLNPPPCKIIGCCRIRLWCWDHPPPAYTMSYMVVSVSPSTSTFSSSSSFPTAVTATAAGCPWKPKTARSTNENRKRVVSSVVMPGGGGRIDIKRSGKRGGGSKTKTYGFRLEILNGTNNVFRNVRTTNYDDGRWRDNTMISWKYDRFWAEGQKFFSGQERLSDAKGLRVRRVIPSISFIKTHFCPQFRLIGNKKQCFSRKIGTVTISTIDMTKKLKYFIVKSIFSFFHITRLYYLKMRYVTQKKKMLHGKNFYNKIRLNYRNRKFH